ncbi:hypothetical protein A176_005419 [Myxococcus hansupus]|uniref:Uncharacterized protein n=2 Tax=Pseudomyxococcus hansupus TaxID=1297742 RepID=A0A0H4XJW1_9BACT|nr:hypothetical protein A176_005419 [Myxococcus hansupus]
MVTFCREALAVPGQTFSNLTGTYSGGLTPGYYIMNVTQSGPFALQNLYASWNGTVAGEAQFIMPQSSNVYLHGKIPPGATPGQVVEVKFTIVNSLNTVVDESRVLVRVGGESPGWTNVWTGAGTAGIAGYTRQYVGDFDGDGAEDILGVADNGWMTMFHYVNGDWQWGWSNYGSTSAGDGIHAYRNNLVVGDFDGDGRDEVLGLSSWVTMFHFDNGTWNWGWSNNGSAQDPLSSHLSGGGYPVVGNFDVVGNSGTSPVNKDELLAVNPNGWLSLFRLNAAGGWDQVWSTWGNTSHGLYLYRGKLRNGGDTNGDGQDELVGFANWATTFRYVNNDFVWNWSTGGANNLAGVGYPLGGGVVFLAGNIDHVDNKDEWFFIDTGASASWATTVDWSGTQFNWNWSNLNSSPASAAIGNWPLVSHGGTNTSYQLVRAVAGQPEFLIARRRFCNVNDMRMYRVSNPSANY